MRTDAPASAGRAYLPRLVVELELTEEVVVRKRPLDVIVIDGIEQPAPD